MRIRARDHLGQMIALEPDWSAPYHIAAIGEERFDQLAERLADLPCPLLDDRGHCSVYSHRPLICRMMGLGWISEEGDLIANDCPIQDDYPAYRALPPVPIPLTAMEREETHCRRLAADALFGTADLEEYETPIAAAISAWIGWDPETGSKGGLLPGRDPDAGENGPPDDRFER